ncbi:efflux RND transporter periplasmic adaptor subunit [Bacteroides thetaiotaomicron]|uniref:efflux RND transporter periplasmic adaptor subunit n=1 Tax=Bacteroides thetaiotaomicron TaxID=818 RepID=UPI00232C20A5|nr:efflux RND transporter periplasmic adaptor subunit [Bacteroides thetaiotaomicron]MDC2010770.1 efflux RND transporter periplasmic adaptor subunit [Bacteroides thetaiotaomicron]MDC2015370.1 efflux RND transporter periplasmic adaptor subunit [Bacteroides thetaiotaomicron]MDC2033222.1 efflux RND transporter periplasmic adaptor subunit [Bacteroides thetaiotaomicron]MDC2037450.1 efflux RND transporter periplasmic adaptor subunit [Bacteroides thetaiotaomicron]MDC2042053.1 efflux RND transporter pe
MKKLMYIFLVLSVLTGCKEKKDAGAMKGMPTLAISVAKPIVKDITLTKDYPGYLTTEKTVNLVARVNGTLQSVSYAPGGRVKKGQLLFVIEPTLYNDKVAQAEAELKTAQAQLEYARNNYSRMKEAVKSDAVSQIQVLQSESSVTEGVAAVSNAEAALSTARTNLGYCYVRAPFDGTISKSTVDIGSYVGGSLQPVTLATIYKDDQMYAYFNVADNQWLEMSMNNQQPTKDLPKKIMVQLGKEGTESYPATLDYLSPNVDLNTGTLMVRANFDNPQGVLKSGLYVSITLPYGEADHAILVKEASIGTDQLGKFLYAVNDSDIVHYRHIEIGQLINDTLRQVLGGLSPQERYVTEALMKVRDGMKIKPMP